MYECFSLFDAAGTLCDTSLGNCKIKCNWSVFLLQWITSTADILQIKESTTIWNFSQKHCWISKEIICKLEISKHGFRCFHSYAGNKDLRNHMITSQFVFWFVLKAFELQHKSVSILLSGQFSVFQQHKYERGRADQQNEPRLSHLTKICVKIRLYKIRFFTNYITALGRYCVKWSTAAQQYMLSC